MSKGGRSSEVLLALDLVGRPVVGRNGRSMGQVIDLELARGRQGWRVVALELGRHGVIDRVRLLRPLARRFGGGEPRLVRWEDVDRLDDGRIRLRAGARAPADPQAEE